VCVAGGRVIIMSQSWSPGPATKGTEKINCLVLNSVNAAIGNALVPIHVTVNAN
jgi:hypothetical protein